MLIDYNTTFKQQTDMTVPAGYKPVVLTTAHRGVFFGYINPDTEGDKLQPVYRCRNCLSWSSDNKGFLGLGSHGPVGEAKIGPAVPRLLLHDVTAVIDVTEAARQEWETQGDKSL